MAKINTSFGVLQATLTIFIIAGCSHLAASTISTQLSSIARGIADRIDVYAHEHEGVLPASWDDLRTYMDVSRMEINLGVPLNEKMLLFGKNHPIIEDAAGVEIVAMTAFPIDEDRRNGIGRYVVYREKSGKFAAKWEAEDAIQNALAKSNVSVPSAAVFQEKLIKPLYPEYGIRLVEDAVRHGVPIEQAVKAVEKHVDDVSNRRAKEATTWAEIADSAIHGSTTPGPYIPNSNAPPATPSRPPSPAQVESPGLATERSAAIWPWIVGIAALVAIVVLLTRRA